MEKRSTFLVTHAEEESAVLHDVADGEVHTLASNPGLDADDALRGTLASVEPLDVTWEVAETERQWSLTVEESEEPPTAAEREVAASLDEGELTTHERAGVGELHVFALPTERVESALTDVLADEATLARAARLGVNRIEVRSDAEAGVVSVRYLP